jgi:integrase
MQLTNQITNMVNLPSWMNSQYREGKAMADLIIKKGKIWYANCSCRKANGKSIRLRDSLKTEDKETAIERLIELRVMVKDGRYQCHKTKFDELVSQYAPKVDAKNKLRNLRVHLTPIFKGKKLSEIDIQGWAENIAGRFPESTAIAIMRPAKELGFVIDYKSLKFIPNKRFDGSQILSEEMALKVLAEIAKRPRAKKYHGICHVAMYSTMPLSDLIHLRKMDVVFTGPDAGITYRRRKTRHHDKPTLFVPMTNKLREAFRLLPTPLSDEGKWFLPFKADAVSNTVSRAFKKCGWHYGSAMHNFRHFGACYLIREGVPLSTIQELMGHSDFNTTLIYARVDRKTLIKGVKRFDAK